MITIGIFVVALLWYLFASCSQDARDSDKPIGYFAAIVIVACLLVWGAL